MDRERKTEAAQRLLTTAHVYRIRGGLEEAARACQDALDIDPDNADAYVLMGDILEAAGQLERAMEHYRKAFQIEPATATEDKIALLALRIDAAKRAEPGFVLSTSPRRRLNPSMACTLSMLLPGLGQLYNGEYHKGLPLIIAWAVLLPNLYFLTMAVLGFFFGARVNHHISGLVWLLALVQVSLFFYAMIDASISAAAINRGGSGGKTGWEV